MFKTAFSTVACPDWLMANAARAAGEWGYEGLELRTFGSGATQFACDPFLTDPAKTRAILREHGVEAAVLATGVSFDTPVKPPVIGFAFTDVERTVRAAKECVDLAAQLEIPFVRVFGFELPRREKRSRGARRVAERLHLVADACRNTGVRVLVENGGSFSTADQMMELLGRVNDPLVGAEFSPAVSLCAGEDPLEGLRLMEASQRVWVVKLKDKLENGRPCQIGDGVMRVRETVEVLAERNFEGWVVVEWDRAWVPGLEPAQEVLPESVKRLYQWVAMSAGSGGRRAALGV
jgi:sugar phosphate isomerase/epimerase